MAKDYHVKVIPVRSARERQCHAEVPRLFRWLRGRALFRGCLALCALASVTQAQQPSAAQGADDATLSRDLLMAALNVRSAPVTKFQVPAGQSHWAVSLAQPSDDIIVARYAIQSLPAFYVQAFFCGREDTDPAEPAIRIDATTLGSTETAREFYDANLVFFLYPPNLQPPCVLAHMRWTSQSGEVQQSWNPEKRHAAVITGHDRAIRHMGEWVAYFFHARSDPNRAAQFFATALVLEGEHLRTLVESDDLQDQVDHLSYLDRAFPIELFDLPLPLTKEQMQQVHGFLDTRLRMRQRLGPFITASPALIERDRSLLRKYP
jgi:hypothetical protein